MSRLSKDKRHSERFGKPERLTDIMRAANKLAIPEGLPQEYVTVLAGKMSYFLKHAPVIEMSEIYKYVEANDSSSNKKSVRESCPNAFPCFDKCICEFIVKDDDEANVQVLCAIHCEKNAERTSVINTMFARQMGDNYHAIYVGTMVRDFDENGEFADDIQKCYPCTPDINSKGIAFWGSVPFWGFAFINCKNTTLDVVEPDRKLNKIRERNNLKPFVRYHTINIEKTKRNLAAEGNLESNGLKKALHICRGHFARYTEDKPLFGRTVGTVWRPSHTRGSIQHGAVISDYICSPFPSSPKEGTSDA